VCKLYLKVGLSFVSLFVKDHCIAKFILQMFVESTHVHYLTLNDQFIIEDFFLFKRDTVVPCYKAIRSAI
jgi:hypothetical protein